MTKKLHTDTKLPPAKRSPRASEAATEEQSELCEGEKGNKISHHKTQSGNAASTQGKTMATTKQRKYAQDFSAHPEIPNRISKVDRSNSAAYDINNIVSAYQRHTGESLMHGSVDPSQFGDASSVSYEDALFHTAELESAFALLPASERAEHGNSVSQWLDHAESLDNEPEPPEAPPAPPDPPPEDAADDNSEA